MSETSTSYIPGVCNINPVEIRKRRNIGHIGLAASIILIIAFLALDVSWYLRLVVFIPLFIGTTGYLQARNKFCVGFAGAGQQHADDGEVVTITEDDALKADKLRARTMNAQVFLIAAIITAIVCVIPV